MLRDDISNSSYAGTCFRFFQFLNLLLNDFDKQKIVRLSVKIDKQCSRVGTCLVGAESKFLLIKGTHPPLSRCFKEIATSKLIKFPGDARNR